MHFSSQSGNWLQPQSWLWKPTFAYAQKFKKLLESLLKYCSSKYWWIVSIAVRYVWFAFNFSSLLSCLVLFAVAPWLKHFSVIFSLPFCDFMEQKSIHRFFRCTKFTWKRLNLLWYVEARKSANCNDWHELVLIVTESCSCCGRPLQSGMGGVVIATFQT